MTDSHASARSSAKGTAARPSQRFFVLFFSSSFPYPFRFVCFWTAFSCAVGMSRSRFTVESLGVKRP